MKTGLGVLLLLTILFLAGVLLWGQVPSSYQVPVWNGQRYVYPRLGPGLTVLNNTLDVLPPPPVRQRVYGDCLAYDEATTSWGTIPAGATNLAIFLNGNRHSMSNFTITSGRVAPVAGWSPGPGCMIVDYDAP